MKPKTLIKGRWTKDEIKTLKRLYRGNPTADVADVLNRPVENVKKQASRLGLTKTKKYLKSLGRTS